jgi:membrane-associated protease RseP (regulator of RpoE activity)
MSQRREAVEEAFAGDIVGFTTHGGVQLGDTITDGSINLQYTGLPFFAPELFMTVVLKNPLRTKQLQQGLAQLGEEGAIQVFRPVLGNNLLLGAIGVLQFEVAAHRLKSEYGVEVRMAPANYFGARWVSADDEAELRRFCARTTALGALLCGAALANQHTAVLLVVPLIVVHELGHLVAARLRGIDVPEFGIGFPPRLFTLLRGRRTELTINALPLGGFVRMAGSEEGDTDPAGWERATLTSKVLVMVAGVAMNIVVAFLLMLLLSGPLAERSSILLEDVQLGSPAAAAGLLPGDRIVGLEGETFDRFDSPLQSLPARAGESVRVTVVSPGQPARDVSIALRTAEEAAGQGYMGVKIASIDSAGPLSRSIGDALGLAATRTWDAGTSIIGALGSFVTSPFRPSDGASGVAGPIGIAVGVSAAAGQLGFVGLLRIAALLSANLAVLNLLPIPPLDGGRVAALFLRRLLGEVRGRRVERQLVTAGAVLMLALFAWISLGDILNLFGVKR